MSSLDLFPGLQYLLDQIAALAATVAGKLDKSGGTMTGPLILSGAPEEPLQAATKQYVLDLTTNTSVHFTGPYNLSASYEVDDGVSYLGNSYVAQVPSTGVAPLVDGNGFPVASEQWGILASRGADGAPGTNGTSITYRNAYNDALTYAAQDVVYFQGNSYSALAETIGVAPLVDDDGFPVASLVWGVVASKGLTGQNGDNGAPGAQGDPGGSYLFLGNYDNAATYVANDFVVWTDGYGYAIPENYGGAPITGVAPPTSPWVADPSTKAAQDAAASEVAAAASAAELTTFTTVFIPDFAGFAPSFFATFGQGITFWATSIVKPWVSKLMGRFNLDDGAWEISFQRFVSQVPTGTRWANIIYGFELPDGTIKIAAAVNKAGEVFALLDPQSLAYIAANAPGLGGIPSDELPVIGSGLAIYGQRGTTFNTYWADGNIGLMLIYKGNNGSGQIMVLSGQRADIQTGNGQSLLVGGGARANQQANLTLICPYPELLFCPARSQGTRGDSTSVANYSGTTAFKSAVEFYNGGDLGECVGTQTLAATQRGLAEAALAIIPASYCCHGAGGQSLANITIGTQCYNNGIAYVTWAAGKFLSSWGYNSTVNMVDWVHGEADRSLGTPYLTYYNGCTNIVNNGYNVDYPPITSQSTLFPIYMNCSQLSSGASGAGDSASASPIAQAQLDLCTNPATLWSGTAPRYLFPHEYNTDTSSWDPLHLDNSGTKLMAEYLGAGRAWLALNRTKFIPLHISAVTLVGNDVVVDFDGTVQWPLRTYSADWLPEHPTWGIQIGSDLGIPSVVAKRISGPRQITYTLPGPLSGTNKYLQVAYNEGGGYANPAYAYSYSNICDSSPAMSVTMPGRPLPNFVWCSRLVIP